MNERLTKIFDKLDIVTDKVTKMEDKINTKLPVPSEKSLKNISTENNYHYVSDNISNLYNDHRFLEHRHDQSIFSLIAKKNNFFVIPDETYWNPDWNVSGKNYPIWATRLRP